MLKLTLGVILRQKSIFSIIFYLFLWKSFKHINSYNGHYYLSKIFLCTSSTCLKSTVIYRSFIEFNSTWNTMVNNTQISCNYLILFHTQFLRIFWKDSNVSFSVTTFEVYDMNIVLNGIFNYALIPDHIIWVLYLVIMPHAH